MSSAVELRANAECENVYISGTSKTTRAIYAVGDNSKVEDVRIVGSFSEGNVVVSGSHVHVDGVRTSSATYASVVVTGTYAEISNVSSSGAETGLRLTGALRCQVVNFASVSDEAGIVIESGSNFFNISANVVSSGADAILIDSSSWGILSAVVESATGDGIVLDTAASNKITAQVFQAGGSNIVVNGDRNLITGCVLRPGTTNYGVEITGGECNMVVGNDLGDPDDYTTDALIDGGANTQLFWPAGLYGDNFTDCGTGS